jgi:microcystin-dependent protein
MDNFVGEIRFFSGTVVPAGWAACNGQQLYIQQYAALYALIGSQFGGNQTSFNLPDLRGRVMTGMTTTGAIVPPLKIGNIGGAETVVLTAATVPSHMHDVTVLNTSGTENITPNPPATGTSGKVLLAKPQVTALTNEDIRMYLPSGTGIMTTLSPDAVSTEGANEAHENRMPYMTLNVCIALQGTFPPRP